MAHQSALMTDFFPQCHSSTTFNTSLSQKAIEELDVCPSDGSSSTSTGKYPHILHPRTVYPLSVKTEMTQSDEMLVDMNVSKAKPSFPSRVKFVRHQSAPLHHRSPVKMRERPMEQEELNEMRAKIRAFRSDMYKYKAAYSRSPNKRCQHTGDVPTSPFKSPAPQTPGKRLDRACGSIRICPCIVAVFLRRCPLTNVSVL